MAHRWDGGGFGSGLGGSFGTSSGYDPHREWEGPYTTRGVNRVGSRVPRQSEDEQVGSQRGHALRGPGGYPGGRPHFSEEVAQLDHQQGYGRSQHPDTIDWQRERGPHYGKGPKGYRRSDDRVREEICEVMSRQGFVDASDVEVTVEGGVVRLVGTVASRADKRALEQMADRVHGVEEVENQIRLKHLVRNANAVNEVASNAPTSERAAPISQKANGRNVHS